MKPLLQVLFRYFGFMKSDLTVKSSRKKQLKPLKGRMEREGGLEQREAMCRFMRLLQREERGALDEAISKLPRSPQPLQNEKKGGSWKGSLAQSRRLSRCIIHAENDRVIHDSLAQREAEKSLIIKNLHLNCSTSHKRLREKPQTPLKRPQLVCDLIKQEMDIIRQADEPELHRSIKKEHGKHRHRLAKIENAARIRTEGNDACTLALDYRKPVKKPLFYEFQVQNGLDNLSRVNITLEKSVPINNFPLSLKSSMHRENRRDIHCTEINLSEHQQDYLKIKRLERSLNGNKLYHTENPKAEPLPPDSHSFRKYSQIQEFEL